MYLYTFYGRDLVVFHSHHKLRECILRYANDCLHQSRPHKDIEVEEEFYLGSKNKCKHCGFVVRIKGCFCELPLPHDINRTRRWYPYILCERTKKILEVIGYELYLKEGLYCRR